MTKADINNGQQDIAKANHNEARQVSQGQQHLIVQKGLYTDWRDRITEQETTPEGTTVKRTTNDKVLTAVEKTNERIEQLSVPPTSVNEFLLRWFCVFTGSRLWLSASYILATAPATQPLAGLMLLVYLFILGVFVVKTMADFKFILVCWWLILALLAGVLV